LLLLLLQHCKGRKSCLLAGFVASLPTIVYMADLFPRHMGTARMAPALQFGTSALIWGLLGVFVGEVAYRNTVEPADPPSSRFSGDDAVDESPAGRDRRH
jgi:hypothetical protein